MQVHWECSELEVSRVTLNRACRRRSEDSCSRSAPVVCCYDLGLALMLRNETHDSARCGLVCLLAEKAIGEF